MQNCMTCVQSHSRTVAIYIYLFSFSLIVSQKKSYYIRLNPLTLSFQNPVEGGKVSNLIESFLRDVKVETLKKTEENVKAECSKSIESCGKFLNTFADVLVTKINEAWEGYYRSLMGLKGELNPFITVPADTRFPGIVNSLADHMVTTSAFAVSAILSLYDKMYKDTGLTCEFEGINVKFNDREFLRGFVRVAALLHDIGKPPPTGHTKRTYDLIYELFKDINEGLAKALANAASKHHYGKNYDKQPSNDIEWVIAYADKASASSRGFIIKEKEIYKKLIDFVKTLSKWGYEIGNSEDLDLLKRMIEGGTVNLSEEEDYQQFRTYGMFNSDEQKVIDLARELINAEKRLLRGKDDKLLAIFYFEIPSIKSYLNRGRELTVYTGYSMLIDSIIHEVSMRLKKEVGEEVVISDEGGSVLAIVPSTLDVNKILDIKELKYFAIKYGLFPFYFAEAHLGPKENWTGWDGQDPYERDIYRGFGALMMKAFSEFDKEDVRLPVSSKEQVEIDKLCKACRVNKRKDGSDYCEACDLAREYYKTFRSLAMEEKTEGEIAEKLKRLRIFKLTKEIIGGIVLPKTLDDLNKKCVNRVYVGDESKLDERRYPVLIVADGDNFGSIKSSAPTLVQYLEITRFFTWIIYTGVLYAINNTVSKIGDEVCVEFYPILLGGDDFSVLTTSQVLPIFAYYLNEALRKVGGWLKKSDLLEGLSYREEEDITEKIRTPKPYQLFTFSAGAYVMKSTTYPLFLAREEAESLEKVSKKYSKTILSNNYNGSGLILTIADYKTIALVEDLSRKITPKTAVKTPTVLGSEINDLLCDVIKLESTEVKYGDLKTFVKISDSTIEIAYNIARNKKESFETVASVLLSNKGYHLQGYYLLLLTLMDALEQKVNSENYWEVYNDVFKCSLTEEEGEGNE